jgi:hypothetical protein
VGTMVSSSNWIGHTRAKGKIWVQTPLRLLKWLYSVTG